ncbi:OmpA family protein [Sphingomonas sp.]|uniref:OmpA family protein n=1 Tax=Sphingomonas sp. TaxID=28214 RepID=UPI003AFFA978
MNAPAARARWTLSFADLCLVLLAFLLMLQANRASPQALGAGIRTAFGASPPLVSDRVAASLFEPGEAILRGDARADLVAIGRGAAAAHAVVTVESRGSDGASRRFDGWELAAARAAAVARAIAEGGLDPVRIDVSVAGMRDATRLRGQRLRITTVPRAA